MDYKTLAKSLTICAAVNSGCICPGCYKGDVCAGPREENGSCMGLEAQAACAITDLLARAEARAKDKWVSVDERLPPEHDSIFKNMIEKGHWADGMYQSVSDEVIVSVRFSDGTKKTGHACTKDGQWVGLPMFGHPVVTHWMPFPEPPGEEGEV